MASPNKFSYFRGKPSKLAVIQRCPGPTGKHSGPEFDHDPLPLIRHTELYISPRVDRNASAS